MKPAESLRSPQSVADDLISRLREHANLDNLPGMASFGISTVGTLGVNMPIVRGLAAEGRRAVGRDPQARHELANALWASGIHEALIMASVADEPSALAIEEADARLLDIDSWDTCDQFCGNLLWKTPYAWELPERWTGREEPFVKRAGFVMMTQLPKDKKAPDERFLPFLELCEREAFDPRSPVSKAINWAIRGIGKRSAGLNQPAIDCAERILAAALEMKPATEASKSARWIARDAIRELKSASVRDRLGLH